MSTHSSVSDAAKTLGISVQRVRTLCREGKLGARKIGNTWMINSDELNQFGISCGYKAAEDHAAYNISDSNKPIALSFFTGAMGLDLGLEKAGFEIRLACESDKYCRQTITLNKPNTALIGDINLYSKEDIIENSRISPNEEIDLVIGGPPCQAFSTAGKRKAFSDNRGNVFLKFLDLAIELNPKYIVIENVRGLLSCPLTHRPHNQRGDEFPDLTFDEYNGGALYFVLCRLKKAGYSYSFNLYNSANFGTPQIRERVIIICSKNSKNPPYLIPTHSENGEFGLKKWNTFKKATAGIKSHTHLNFPEKRIRFYKMLKPGQNWKNLPEKYQKEAMGKSFYSGGGKTGFLRRLHWNKPSPTLVTHPAMPATDLSHPEENRPLSIQEYKRVQEFPDNWKLAGPLIQQYKQIGNAVPLSLGKAVGDLLVKLLKKEKIVSNFSDFKYSRYKNTNDSEWTNKFKQQFFSK